MFVKNQGFKKPNKSKILLLLLLPLPPLLLLLWLLLLLLLLPLLPLPPLAPPPPLLLLPNGPETDIFHFVLAADTPQTGNIEDIL